MKTNTSSAHTSMTDNSIYDAFLLMLAGAAMEMQTRGEVKPFGKQRLTLRTLTARQSG
jgi:hypothetical protein